MTGERAPVRPHRGRRRLVAALLVIAAVLAAGVMLWGRPQGAAPSGAAPGAQQKIPVQLAPYDVTVAGPGILRAARTVQLSTPANLAGTIAAIARQGDRVERGAELARLDAEAFERELRDAEIGLERAQSSLATLQANQSESEASARQGLRDAEARVELARRELERAQQQAVLSERLLELGTESAEAVQAARDTLADASAQLDDATQALENLRSSQALQVDIRVQERREAELAVTQAQLDLADAQENLRKLSITAPFAGVVSEVDVEEGSIVGNSTTLLTLIDDSRLDLPVQIDETEIALVAPGQSAQVLIDARPGSSVPGTVTAIAPVARLESNIPIFDVTVSLENADLAIRPGMTAESQITVAHFEETATVTTAALWREGGQVHLQLERDGEELRVPVQEVDTVGFESVVTGELRAGDEILLPGGAVGGPANRGRVRPPGMRPGMTLR